MNLLFDTNILIHLAKDTSRRLLTTVINPDNQKIFISVVSISELKSIAVQNKWGIRKWNVVNAILDEAVIIEINEGLTDTYAEIDAFSQRRNPSYANYSFDKPRNMGKNDLWIASTAALLGLKLVTTDADFNHLHQIFIEVQHIKPEFL
ncbi:type II toxin-antitoxin system VapC family toxin [Mucilaginibacter gotjawali]|uniref:tRNA(FMet)-specific endonuclease VapC n=2 Tax=Mucilaginibacter gotjawali TaxID=1550579 RepID=A0A0X8X000_9SPHI|nr:type II toxin-antitoxin system VapC family toxin [Mucilaginibacter gotjawali]MBB3055383.1 tRNA(fMet)-specific endonuclease VapC [Mucilaginibacter gotjawali]BAU53340.1 tRNA(fMet)-specific endonuclease VapC [Mucilaginibacter gotjawali]